MFFEVYDADSCLAVKHLFSRVEVRYMIVDSSKPNKLRNVYTIRSMAKQLLAAARGVEIRRSCYLQSHSLKRYKKAMSRKWRNQKENPTPKTEGKLN